jgi:phosphoglycolate phosphatase
MGFSNVGWRRDSTRQLTTQTYQMGGNHMTTRAVVFDLDGTLVDTAPDLMGATNHVLSLLDRRSITMEEVRAFVGHGAKVLIARGANATGDSLDEKSLNYYFAEFLRYYEKNIAVNSAIFPGVGELLKLCESHGIKMAVCTNKLEGLSVRLLNELGLSRYFGAIVGPDTISIAKPDPAPYFETLKRLNVAAEDSIMIGDSETDILTARAAKVPVIAVTFGYTQTPVAEFKPDYLVSHFDEIWDILKKH